MFSITKQVTTSKETQAMKGWCEKSITGNWHVRSGIVRFMILGVTFEIPSTGENVWEFELESDSVLFKLTWC
jgi:hypothetical protein